MEDTAETGSVAPEASAGAPAQPTTPTTNGSPEGVSTNPFSGLQDEGARKWVETKGYKSAEDVVTAARSLESKLGTAVTVPTEDASPEDWQSFYSRLPETMRPVESPDKIEFKRPDGLPEDFAYSDEFASATKTWLHEAQLNPKQAQLLHDKWVGFQAEQHTANQAAIAQSVETTYDDLVKDWGPTESEGFKAKLTGAVNSAKQLGLVDVFKARGIILPDGTLTDPQVARALVAINEKMFAEDTIGSDGIPTADNPFKGDASGVRNMTAISALVKADPERAKRLAREAGVDPTPYFPSNPR